MIAAIKREFRKDPQRVVRAISTRLPDLTQLPTDSLSENEIAAAG
jgi:hypothetical protein